MHSHAREGQGATLLRTDRLARARPGRQMNYCSEMEELLVVNGAALDYVTAIYDAVRSAQSLADRRARPGGRLAA